MQTLIGLICLFAANQAYAGCANYEDGSMSGPAPVYKICYKSECDITTMAYECANVTSYSAGYTIGWSMQCDVIPDGGEGDCTILWQGRPIDPGKNKYISFKVISE